MLVNLDKKEMVSGGGKQCEITSSSAIKVVLLNLLWKGVLESRRWSGDRIVIVGDYSDENPFLTEEDEKMLSELDPERNLYGIASDHFTEVADRDAYYTGSIKGLDGDIVIINMDKKEFLDSKYMAKERLDPRILTTTLDLRFLLTALVLLITYSSGGGGGDLDISCGEWAGDRISIGTRKVIADDYQDISPVMKERCKEVYR